jgi:cobalt/nickel transport protein
VTVLSEPWIRRSLVVLVALVALSPLFGWASASVGYAEPLENAAEAAGAEDAAAESPSVFGGYSVPGVDGAGGTLVSALVGTGLTLAAAVGLGRLLER